jgi:hypothetical protein
MMGDANRRGHRMRGARRRQRQTPRLTVAHCADAYDDLEAPKAARAARARRKAKHAGRLFAPR